MDARYPQNPARAVTAAAVVDRARSYIGTPWRHQGRDSNGCDCVGLIIMVASDLNLISGPIRANYGRLGQLELVAEVRARCTPAGVVAAVEGALALICWPGESEPAHAGILTGRNIIHSYRNAGGVVEHGYRNPWPRWTHSLWHLPGVSYG